MEKRINSGERLRAGVLPAGPCGGPQVDLQPIHSSLIILTVNEEISDDLHSDSISATECSEFWGTLLTFSGAQLPIYSQHQG